MQIVNTTSFCVSNIFTTNKPSFSRSFAIGFTPDAVIIRQITYGLLTDDQGIAAIHTDLVFGGDGIIGHVVSTDAVTSGITVSASQMFKVQSNANGSTFRFTMMAPDPNNVGQFVPDNLADGTLLMNLEFIQYKK